MEFKHVSILLQESIDFLITDKNGIYLDCTMGGAGHTCGFAAQLEQGGLMIGIDQDEDAIKAASGRLLGNFKCRTAVAKSNFENFDAVLDEMGIGEIDGIFFDEMTMAKRRKTEREKFISRSRQLRHSL